MPIDGRIPFTEIVEQCQVELIRERAPAEESKYQGTVNRIYSNDLPGILPELFIKKEAFFTLVADDTVGTVTVGTGTSNIIGVGTSWTSSQTDSLLKVNGFDVIYRVTFAASTSLTFNDSLTWIGSSGTGNTYTLFKDRYQLPSDFSHLIADDSCDPHVVYRWVGGKKIFMDLLSEEEFERNDAVNIGTPYAYYVKWIKEIPYLYITLSADSAEIVGYSYIPQLTTLSEYTTGTITFTTGTAVILATGTVAWTSTVSTGTNTYYIRNDTDGSGSGSKWTKINTVVSNTQLTLSSAWAYTSGTGQTYTISEISKWPSRFDDAMIYRTCAIIDPDNVNIQKWNNLYIEAVGLDRSEESHRSQTREFKSWPGLRNYRR